MIFAGIDPGSLRTGYAFIEPMDTRIKVLEYGTIRSKTSWNLPEKLNHIYQTISGMLDQYSPSHLAMETAFVGKYPSAALALGHVRGCVMTAAAGREIPVFEYAPRVVKKSVVGTGGASKDQIAGMLMRLLSLESAPASADAADALAVAFCHNIRFRGHT